MKRSRILTILTAVAVLAVSLSAFAATGKTTIKLYEPKLLNGQELKAGEYNVKWERNSSEAEVTFLQGKKVVATAKGKFVDRGQASQNDALVTKRNGSAHEQITELRFAGKSEVLLLAE
ncbi:MAG TPA: hypothetical protein VNK82_14215 [Terriglobales bacterium]|nr:hypothetical protein [Terriglobales bacterium]